MLAPSHDPSPRSRARKRRQNQMTISTITGRCLCGKIRYEADGEPFIAVRCHCRDCQYASGGEPTAALSVARSALRVLGEPRVFESKADSGVTVCRSFCVNCGTPLFSGSERNPEFIAIQLGSHDDPSKFAPAGHIWTSSAQPWHHINSDAAFACSKNFGSSSN